MTSLVTAVMSRICKIVKTALFLKEETFYYKTVFRLSQLSEIVLQS